MNIFLIPLLVILNLFYNQIIPQYSKEYESLELKKTSSVQEILYEKIKKLEPLPNIEKFIDKNPDSLNKQLYFEEGQTTALLIALNEHAKIELSSRGNKNKSERIIELIINKMIKHNKMGAINTENENGITALHFMASMNMCEMIKKIVNIRHPNGKRIIKIDPIENILKMTPAQVACKKGHKDVLKIFKLIEKEESAGKSFNHKEDDYYMENLMKVFDTIYLEKIKDLEKREYEENTDLHMAILENNTNEVKKQLEINSKSLYVQNKNGNTPLHLAVALTVEKNGTEIFSKYKQIYEIINLIIDKILEQKDSAKILNTQNIFGSTALHIAISTNKKDIVTRLITTNKMNLEIQDNDLNTPLHSASTLGFLEIIEMLATNKNIYTKNNFGGTPLHSAAASGDGKAVLTILQHCPTKKIIFEKTATGRMAIHYAPRESEAFSHLVSLHNKIFSTLELKLIGHKTSDFISSLKDLKMKNIENLTALETGRTLLHIASRIGDIEKMAAILENFDIDINIKSYESATPLMEAICESYMKPSKNKIATVKLLLEHGADVNISDLAGNSPLQFAIQYNDAELIELILENKNLDINKKNNEGINALGTAVENNNVKITKLLIKYGAKIDKSHINMAHKDFLKKILIKGAKEQEANKIDVVEKKIISEKEAKQNALKLIAELELNPNKKSRAKKINKRGSKKRKSKNNEISKNDHVTTKTNLKDAYQIVAEAAEKRAKKCKLEKEKRREKTIEQIRKEEELKQKRIVKEQKKKQKKSERLALQKQKKLEKKVEAVRKISKFYKNSKNRNHISNIITLIDKINVIKIFNKIAFNSYINNQEILSKHIEKSINEIIKYVDQEQNNAIHLFASHGIAKKYIQILIEYGIDINKQNKNGYTPIHLAVYYLKEQTVQDLIELGANVNTSENHLGFTPLHEAVNKKNRKMVQILIEADADINAITNDGKSLYSWKYWIKLIEYNSIRINKNQNQKEESIHNENNQIIIDCETNIECKNVEQERKNFSQLYKKLIAQKFEKMENCQKNLA